MKKGFLALLWLVILASLSSVYAYASIPVNPGDFTGSRSTSDGDVFAAAYWDGVKDHGFQIAWNITQSGSTYSYEYTISGIPSTLLSLGLKGFILEVTDPSQKKNFTDQDPQITLGPKLFTPGPGELNLPGDIYGIKYLDDTQPKLFEVSFDSQKAPVWGDFYAFTCNDTYAYNLGFGTDPAMSTPAMDLVKWIPTPNGDPVPVPSSVLLFGSGLIGFGVSRFRKKV
jgi:hypothetical protein